MVREPNCTPIILFFQETGSRTGVDVKLNNMSLATQYGSEKSILLALSGVPSNWAIAILACPDKTHGIIATKSIFLNTTSRPRTSKIWILERLFRVFYPGKPVSQLPNLKGPLKELKILIFQNHIVWPGPCC